MARLDQTPRILDYYAFTPEAARPIRLADAKICRDLVARHLESISAALKLYGENPVIRELAQYRLSFITKPDSLPAYPSTLPAELEPKEEIIRKGLEIREIFEGLPEDKRTNLRADALKLIKEYKLGSDY